MGNLITTYTAILTYVDNLSCDYGMILNRARDKNAQLEKLHYEIQSDLESISRQIVRGRRIYDEIQIKVEKYKSLMDDAAAEVSHCDDEIDYIYSHPITRTYTDSDGDSYTVEEIDEAALSAARRARDRAQAEYESYREKYINADGVKCEVSSTVNRFETIKSGIEKIAQMIQNDIYEIKKYISAIENESNYNLQHTRDTAESVNVYLNSKSIFMPVGAHYADFSSGGSSYSSTSSMGSGTNSKKVAMDEAAATTVGTDFPRATITSYPDIGTSKTVSEHYYNKQSKRDAKSLDFSQKRSLEKYLNNNDLDPTYTKINGYLRNGGDSSSDILQTIDSMTETLSSHTLKRGTVLYRGIKRDGAEKIFGEMSGKSIDDLRKNLEGATFVEKGFSSTSISKDDVLKSYVSYKGILFEINAPCGAEGIYTKNIAKYADTEHEVLLQRGGIFTVDRIRDCGDYYHINVTLIGRCVANE